jgi:hypothetical protein
VSWLCGSFICLSLPFSLCPWASIHVQNTMVWVSTLELTVQI